MKNTEKTHHILGIFAHPDDETFCAGGTLAKHAASGAETMVVSFTRGEAGQIRDANVASRRTLGEVRVAELRNACKCLGVQHVECLDFGDGKVKDHDPLPLIAKTVETIRSFRPDVVITFGEDGAYGHPDHIAACKITTEACLLSGDPQNFPDQIEIGLQPYKPPRLYYSHFPRSRTLLLEEIVQWLTGLDRQFRGSHDFAQAFLLFSQETTTLRFNRDFIDIGWYPPGFYIVEQGEPAASLFLILSGRVRVEKESSTGQREILNELGPGDFFGELGIAHRKPRMAHVIATESSSCLVFSPGESTAYSGRGEQAQHNLLENSILIGGGEGEGATTCVDVSDYVVNKINAIASHHSQYPISPDMFPMPMLQKMFGREYFLRVFPVQEMETDILPI